MLSIVTVRQVHKKKNIYIKHKQSDENGVAFYGIQADEVRDTSNVEHLGVVIRYIKNNIPIEKKNEFAFVRTSRELLDARNSLHVKISS